MNVYDIIASNLPIVLVLIFIAIMSAVFYGRTKQGKGFFSRVLLKFPLIGRILKQSFISMFCRTLSTLLGAGVSVLEALDILSSMTQNKVIRTAVQRTKGHIIEGANMSVSMTASGFFPSMVTKMTQVGEGSGSLPAVLDRTSSFYERKVDTSISRLTGALEPIMIVTVGAIVLVVVIALYLPIFSISNIKN